MDPFRRYSRSKSKVVRNRAEFWTFFSPSRILGGLPSKSYTHFITVTHVDFIKTAEHIIEMLSLSDRPTILVFVTKGCCVNLTVSPLTGAPNTRGVAKTSNFQPICGYLGNGNRAYIEAYLL